jgi:hypothetical protein
LLASIPDGDDNFQPGPAWSPDGQTIAVPVLLRGERVRWILAIVSVADGSVRELYSYPHEIGRAVWLTRGDALAMTIRDQTGRGQLWAIPYPRGKPARLTNDLEDYEDDIDITRDGKNVIAIATALASDVWTIPDADASRGRQITSSGVALLQVAAMPLRKMLVRDAEGEMWLAKTDGTERSLFTTARNANSPVPCADSVVFNSFHDDTVDLIRVDADGLNPTRLFKGDIGPATCSNDGHYIFFASKVKPYAILRLSSGGGDPIEITKSPGYEIKPRLSISPDGKLLAYAYDEALPATGTKLAVIPVRRRKHPNVRSCNTFRALDFLGRQSRHRRLLLLKGCSKKACAKPAELFPAALAPQRMAIARVGCMNAAGPIAKLDMHAFPNLTGLIPPSDGK